VKVVNLAKANQLATRTPTLQLKPGRHISTVKRFRNAKLIITSGGKPYIKVTIKDSSTYRGAKGNDMSVHLVYNSNRTFIEIHDRKSDSDRLGPRLNSGATKDSIQDIVDKCNGYAAWSAHFTFSVIQDGNDIVFDSAFTDPGQRFRGGRGR